MNFQVLYAQKTDYLYGTILDANTNEPIVFANVYLKGREVGTTSNMDGGFRVPYKYREMGTELVISSMGYESKELSILEFSTTENTLIKLKPALYLLNEAVVKAPSKTKTLSAEDIVQRSINSILDNYPVIPYSQIGYYRDYQLDKVGYVNLNEAILEVFDQGFNSIDSLTSKVLIYSLQQNSDFPIDSIAIRPYDYDLNEGGKVIDNAYLDSHGGNEFTLLQVHNAIRNHVINSYSFINRFDRDLLKNHTFTKKKDTYIENELLYTIEFKKVLPKIAALGRLYISKFDYSIYKLEYFVYNDSNNDQSGTPSKNEIDNRLIFEVITEYRKKQGRMFLNFISFHNKFKVVQPPKFKLKNVDINFQGNTLEKNNLKIDEQSFILTFDNDLDVASSEYLRNRKISFKNQKIKIKRVLILGNQMVIYPNLESVKSKKIFEKIEISAKNKRLTIDLFDFNIHDLKDVDGNKLDVWTEKGFDQFREFFVQETIFKPPVIEAELFMKKDRPIFDNQPMSKPEDFKDYWMNTPLPNIKN